MGHRDIPVLETKRLILRGPEPQDYPDFKATFAGCSMPQKSATGKSAVSACG